MKNISSIKNRNDKTLCAKNCFFRRSITLLLAIFFLLPGYVSSKEGATEKTLIVYYSRTGKTKLVSETLKNHLSADLIEVKDLKDRKGTWGYVTAAFDAIFNRHTPIEPEKIDLSPYQAVIVATPIWNWKISTPIHTFLEANRFDGKKVMFITNANIHLMKYEQYGDDAPFMKRFLKDYIRGKKKAAQSLFMTSGGNYIGHYHLETEGKTSDGIIEDTLKFADDIKHIISRGKMDMAEKVTPLHDMMM